MYCSHALDFCLTICQSSEICQQIENKKNYSRLTPFRFYIIIVDLLKKLSVWKMPWEFTRLSESKRDFRLTRQQTLVFFKICHKLMLLLHFTFPWKTFRYSSFTPPWSPHPTGCRIYNLLILFIKLSRKFFASIFVRFNFLFNFWVCGNYPDLSIVTEQCFPILLLHCSPWMKSESDGLKRGHSNSYLAILSVAFWWNFEVWRFKMKATGPLWNGGTVHVC